MKNFTNNNNNIFVQNNKKFQKQLKLLNKPLI